MVVEFDGATFETREVAPRGVPRAPEAGFWSRIPAFLRWSAIIETEGEKSVTWKVGAFSRVLCQGKAASIKAARRELEREREQATVRMIRNVK